MHPKAKALVHGPEHELECELLAFDPESCHLTGRIVNISADERILTDGQIDTALLHPVTYDPVRLEYRALGAPLAKAFACGKRLDAAKK